MRGGRTIRTYLNTVKQEHFKESLRKLPTGFRQIPLLCMAIPIQGQNIYFRRKEKSDL
jgi:hypothetical protein